MYPERARDGSPLLKRSSAVMDTLSILRDRWAFALLVETYFGVSRFDDYQHNLGISRNVLTKRLGALVQDGILKRVLYQSRPDRYEYKLTDKGRAMYPIFLAIQQWGEDYLGDDEPRGWRLVHTSCGRTVSPRLSCDQCGEPITVSDIRLVPDPDRQTTTERGGKLT